MIDWPDAVIRLTAAAVVGGVIGLDREVHRKPTGVRTMGLVALGSALVVLVSHGAAIGLGIARLLGLPERNRVLGPLGNCSWSVLGQRWGNWRLLEHNVGQLPDLDPEPVPVLAAGPEEEPAPASQPGSPGRR